MYLYVVQIRQSIRYQYIYMSKCLITHDLALLCHVDSRHVNVGPNASFSYDNGKLGHTTFTQRPILYTTATFFPREPPTYHHQSETFLSSGQILPYDLSRQRLFSKALCMPQESLFF